MVLLGIAGGARAATDPALPGPHAAGVRTEQIPVTGGSVLETDVHFPSLGGEVDPAAGPCPLLVFGHGFSSNKEPYRGHGAHWATRGYITLIPTMVGFSDHGRNADDLVALVSWALAENQDPSSFLHGRIDPDAIGASGHSAGGLSALVAAARDPRIRAVAPFDPVDSNDLGVNAMPAIGVPVAITHSEDHPCNANGSSRVLYAAAVPVKRRVHVVGANHCDPLSPADLGCGIVCGFADPARQESYRRYVTGWFEYWLRCDASYFEWVYGARVLEDAAAGTIVYEASPDPGPNPPCAPGTPPGDVAGLRVARSGADVLLRWDPVAAVPPVSEYRVYRSGSLPFAYGVPVDRPAGENGADAGAVGAGPLFFYQVRAVNAAGEGP